MICKRSLDGAFAAPSAVWSGASRPFSERRTARRAIPDLEGSLKVGKQASYEGLQWVNAVSSVRTTEVKEGSRNIFRRWIRSFIYTTTSCPTRKEITVSTLLISKELSIHNIIEKRIVRYSRRCLIRPAAYTDNFPKSRIFMQCKNWVNATKLKLICPL